MDLRGGDADRVGLDEKPVFPTKQMLLVAFALVCSNLSISVLFPFLPFAVASYGIAGNEKEIGYYTGILEATFMIGRGVMAVPYGIVSDKYGRKSVLVFCCASGSIFLLLFGLSRSFWTAFAVRLATGLTNGMLGPAKALASELGGQAYAGRSMAWVSAAAGVGMVGGPFLGGFLSNPASNWPTTFSGTVFESFPYLLPCVVCAVPGVFATVALVRNLRETFPSSNVREKGKSMLYKELEEDVEGEGVAVNGSVDSKRLGAREGKRLSTWQMLRTGRCMGPILCYSLLSFVDMMHWAVLPLFATTSTRLKGLEFSSDAVGILTASVGVGVLVIQLLVFPSFERHLGPRRLFSMSALICAPCILVISGTSTLLGHLPTLWATLIVVMLCRDVASRCMFISAFMMINNSVEHSQRGAVNGLGMAIASAFKALGPGLGGTLFSISLAVNTFPCDIHFVFMLMALIMLVLGCAQKFLHKTVDKMPE